MEFSQFNLAGGSEFGREMALTDSSSIASAGGLDTPIAKIPTAVAPDNSHRRAVEISWRWYTSPGATNVQVPLIDCVSAKKITVVELVIEARIIYLLGSFSSQLCESLLNTKAWAVTRAARAAGAMVAGSIAGTIVLYEHLYEPLGT